MAKLRVSPELVMSIFGYAKPDVRVVGASFEDGFVVLNIEGPDVPDAESVIAIVHVERMHVEFEAVE